MTEFDDQDVAAGGEPSYEPGGHPGGPDLSEALGQMQAAYQPGAEVPAPAYEDGYGDERPYEGEGFADDGYYEGGYPDEGHEPEQLSGEETVQQLFAEAAQEAVQPYIQQMEWERRQSDVLALAEQYPQLRQEETLAAVEQELDAIAEIYGDGARTDPRLVEQALLAHEARAAAQAGAAEQARQPSPEQGPHVETGVGPGVPAEQMDPVEAAYTKALAGPRTDPWGFPLS
jgi:hypothetical protein